MGEVLFHTGLAMKSIDAFALLIRRVPGRLAVIAIVAGTVFSAISGSTIATTAMLGSLMLPTMLERGYEPKIAMGPIMGIGGVDILIPPSALAVLLGSLAGISISGLLIGGIVPGLILSALFIGYVIAARLARSVARAERRLAAGRSGLWELWLAVPRHVLPLMRMFAIVVGTMTGGWATPTEAARSAPWPSWLPLLPRPDWARLMKSLLGTVSVSGSLLFIIVGATTFAQLLSFSGATAGLVALVSAQGSQRPRS